MHKKGKKIESSLSARRLENSFLRIFRSVTGLQASPISIERADHEDAYDYSQREIRNTMLEAEYTKAMAVMERQRHQNL